MAKKDIDMINGPLYKSVIAFTLPLIATNVLSQLYHNVDMIVVGRLCGARAVAAVGATSSMVSLIVALFLGLSVGTGIVVAQCRGKGDAEEIKKAVHTSVYSAFGAGAVLTVLGLIIARPMLGLMGTPDDIIDDSALYLSIYFAGILLRMTYVFTASVLRALGDSRTPFVYLTVGGALNVVFNLFFVAVLKMTVDGVAWGTVISEGVSALLCLRALMKRTDGTGFAFGGFKKYFSGQILLRTVKIGVPAGLQGSLFAISNVIIQSNVNAFGSATVAGNSAAGSTDNIVYLAATSFGAAAAMFMGQNWGAGNMARIKKLPAAFMFWMGVITAAISGLMFIFAKPLIALFIKNDPAALEAGVLKLKIMLTGYLFLGVGSIHSNLLRGMGRSVSSAVIDLLFICVLRVGFVLITLRIIYSPVMIFIAYPISYAASAAASVLYYYPTLKKAKKLRAEKNTE